MPEADEKTDAPIVMLTVSEFRAILREELKAAMQRHNAETATDRLLSVPEAAKILNLSAMWLYKNWKHLPFSVRIGRSVKFSHKGIQRWMEAQRRS